MLVWQLFRKSFLLQVPSLNDVPVHYLKPNSLVKFRCMVQDMFDPEFYMGVYETVDPNTNARVSEILTHYFCKCLVLTDWLSLLFLTHDFEGLHLSFSAANNHHNCVVYRVCVQSMMLSLPRWSAGKLLGSWSFDSCAL